MIISVREDKLPKLAEKMPLIKKKGMSYVAQGMISNLTRNSPVDHGLLRQWFIYSNSGDTITIRSPAHYAKFVNDGTGIFGPRGTPIIHPSIGKKFAFQVNGQMIYTRMIRGQKGQHFVERSIEQTKPQIGNFMIKAVREVLG